MPRRTKLSASYLEDVEVHCAQCDSAWSMELIASAHAERRLRALGFAFIDFGDAICLNYCPHCELKQFQRETYPCLIPSLLLSL